MAKGLRPLTTGEVLDRSFQIYRTNFGLFAGISAVPNLSLLAVQLLFLLVVSSSGRNPVSFALATSGMALVMLLVSVVASSIGTAATTFGVSDIYLDKPTSIPSCFARVKGKIGKVAFTSLELGLRVGLGFILLIIPGFYFAGKWGLAIPAVVLEDISRKQAFPRSAILTKDSAGRVITVYFLAWILIVSISMGVAMVLTIVAPSFARAAGTTTSQVVQYLINAGVNIVVTPVMSIALTVLYYDQRVRKEAFDIQNLMALMGPPSSQAAVSATSSK